MIWFTALQVTGTVLFPCQLGIGNKEDQHTVCNISDLMTADRLHLLHSPIDIGVSIRYDSNENRIKNHPRGMWSGKAARPQRQMRCNSNIAGGRRGAVVRKKNSRKHKSHRSFFGVMSSHHRDGAVHCSQGFQKENVREPLYKRRYIYETKAVRYRFRELRLRASSSSGRLAKAVAAWA
jgi:hypothetical protein